MHTTFSYLEVQQCTFPIHRHAGLACRSFALRCARPTRRYVLLEFQQNNRFYEFILTNLNLDDGQSYLNEPPETPAPVFAVRAFKSALFGTPKIDQEFHSTTPLPMTPDHRLGKKPQHAEIEPAKMNKLGPKINEEDVHKAQVTSLLSPAKGILMTPGTGTTRRKNVSFGGLGMGEKEKKESKVSNTDLGVDAKTPLVAHYLSGNQCRQTSLTKTLFKAKIGLSQDQLEDHTETKNKEGETIPIKSNCDSGAGFESHADPTDRFADTTIDLNQPFSRSGKHWKAEFERYHKKSDREMKRIIKHGQNVKSYAVRKDSEASDLGEKLRLELSKVALMEAKVSKLAAQLASTRPHNPNDPAQSELVGSLAKQTALAVRYKQKADRYKAALSKKTAAAVIAENEMESTLPQSVKIPDFQEENLKQVPQVHLLNVELEKCREFTKLAEVKANKLEAENLELRKTLARVKAEVSIGGTERRARKADLERNEASLKSVRDDWEKRHDQITSESQKLLPESRFTNDRQRKPEDQMLTPSESRKRLTKPNLTNTTVVSNATIAGEILGTFKPIHETKLQDSHVDIWTLSIQENQRTTRPAQNEKADSISAGISTVLKEITQNFTPERKSENSLRPSSNTQTKAESRTPTRRPITDALLDDKSVFHDLGFEKSPSFAPQPIKSSAAKRMRERRSTIVSPRPSMFNIASSPPKHVSNPKQADLKPQAALASVKPEHVHSESLVSTAAARPRTIGERKLARLPPDRIAAAKARLKERNRERMSLGNRRESGEWRRTRADSKGVLTKVEGSGEMHE